MKKFLIIVLVAAAVLALVGGALALPRAFADSEPDTDSAVDKPVEDEATQKYLLIYSEDFEGSELSDKSDLELTRALGWTQWIDVPDTDEHSYDEGYVMGLNGWGYASIEEEYDVDANLNNHCIRLTYGGNTDLNTTEGAYRTGDDYGWGIQFVNDELLTGGDYILEYTLKIDQSSDVIGARGVGFRNNRCWAYMSSLVGTDVDFATMVEGMTYQTQIKYDGRYDMHLKESNELFLGSSASSHNLTQISGLDCTDNWHILGYSNSFRTIVNSTKGVHTYVKNHSGEWVYYFGMDASQIDAFANSANLIGSGVIMRIATGVSATLDDIAVYSVLDGNIPVIEVPQNQVVADGGLVSSFDVLTVKRQRCWM